MARCEECLHYKVCLNSESQHLRIILAGNKADERCRLFKATADVVQKSEVVEMQKEQLGRLKEIKSEVERVTVEYEAMRGAANSYKMHYEQAKTEVERLQAEVDQLHALLECGVFANSVEDWQKFLNEKRAEVARQIFEEIEKIIQNRRNEEIKRQGDNKMVSPFTYCYDALNVIQHQIAELKKKYTE